VNTVNDKIVRHSLA